VPKKSFSHPINKYIYLYFTEDSQPYFFMIVGSFLVIKITKKFCEELITYFPLVQHRPQRKRHTQQFFYCIVCISWRGNVVTEPLPSN
jgi:hypothetical protein